MKYEKSRRIIQKIAEKEIQQNNLDIEVLSLTNKEKILHFLKNESKRVLSFNYKNKKSYFYTNFSSKVFGYLEEETNVLKIFLDNIRKNKELCPDKYFYLLNLLIITYHELNHKAYYDECQKEKDLTLKKLIYLVERCCQDNSKLYNDYAEEFYVEIIANTYSIKKTKEILNKYPTIYEKIREYLDILTLYNEILYYNYDIEKFINYINNGDSAIMLFNNKELSRELILDNEWNKEELETKYTLLSTRTLLKKISYKNLTHEELEILLDALSYSLKIEKDKNIKNKELKQQLKYYNEKYQTNSEINILKNLFIEKSSRNIQKIKYLSFQIDLINKEIKTKDYKQKRKTK